MGGNILKVRLAFIVTGNAFAIIGDAQELFAAFLAANDADVLRLCINAVLDELCDGLERIVLRERDDGDRAPGVADAQFSFGPILSRSGSLLFGWRRGVGHAAVLVVCGR